MKNIKSCKLVNIVPYFNKIKAVYQQFKTKAALILPEDLVVVYLEHRPSIRKRYSGKTPTTNPSHSAEKTTPTPEGVPPLKKLKEHLRSSSPQRDFPGRSPGPDLSLNVS